MQCYQELYGADADGNRGVVITNAEIASDDTDDIKAQLEMMYHPGQALYTISLYCHQYDTEHEFEVDINDYLTPEKIKGLT